MSVVLYRLAHWAGRRRRIVLAAWLAALVGTVALAIAAGGAMPVSALIVEAISDRAENWIFVVYVVIVVAAGAAIGAALPKSSTAERRRGRVLRWAGAGVGAAIVGSAVWLVLLAG